MDVKWKGIDSTCKSLFAFALSGRKQEGRFVRPQAAPKIFLIFAHPFTFAYNTLNNSLFKQVKGNFVLSLFGLFAIFYLKSLAATC